MRAFLAAIAFQALAAGRLPPDPTVYLCAQDRPGRPGANGPERLMALVNAPARPLAGPDGRIAPALGELAKGVCRLAVDVVERLRAPCR